MKAVDLFAGWGGFSEGARMAGVEVVWAANHWQLAVDAHAVNHPGTKHSCQELGGDTNYSRLPDFDLLLASPACQGHSRAAHPSRANTDRVRVHHDELRATAWAVVGCADTCLPKSIIVENVEDFRNWRLYPRWRGCLEDLGYHVQELVLRLSHFDTPQRRDRLFVVATRKPVELGLPVVDASNRRRVLSIEPAFGPCIDWDADVPWTAVRNATPAVKDRIARGRAKLGRRFIGQHVGDGGGLVPLDEPIRTITTKDQWFVCRDDEYRPLTIRENARAMGFRDDYFWPKATRKNTIKGIGNSVGPRLAKRLIEVVSAVS